MRKNKSAGDAKSSSMSWGVLIVLCIACFILVFDILQNLFAGSTVVTGSDLAFGLTVFSVGIGIDLAILANVTISSIKKHNIQLKLNIDTD